MEKEEKLQSSFQMNDLVDLNFYSAGIIKNCKVVGIKFEEHHIYYDLLIPVAAGAVCRIENIFSGYLQKIK